MPSSSRLGAARSQLQVRPVESHIEVAVSDTGVGIDAALLPHVFERFRQGEGATTREYGGLGLGLAIVRHLVELHGGTVHASSGGVGQGATFRVRLPLAAVQASQALAGSAGAAVARRQAEIWPT